jgi:hypothetical protein
MGSCSSGLSGVGSSNTAACLRPQGPVRLQLLRSGHNPTRCFAEQLTSGGADTGTTIWGTSISIAAAKAEIRRFFLHGGAAAGAETPAGRTPGTPRASGEAEMPLYMRLVHQVGVARGPGTRAWVTDVNPTP